MARIAVFDSGLGSLALVGRMRRAIRAEIIYLADSRSYPYGAMRPRELRAAAAASIDLLRERFSPDVIVVGSNTPSLLAPDLLGGRVIGVVPPVRRAARLSKTRQIAVLATRSVVRSAALGRHIAAQTAGTRCGVRRIDATALVDLAETARFATNPAYCAKIVRRVLARTFARSSIDVATLSSTHLPHLLPILEREFPHVSFIDPGSSVAARAARLAGPASARPRLRVYATARPGALTKKLARLGYTSAAVKI